MPASGASEQPAAERNAGIKRHLNDIQTSDAKLPATSPRAAPEKSAERKSGSDDQHNSSASADDRSVHVTAISAAVCAL